MFHPAVQSGAGRGCQVGLSVAVRMISCLVSGASLLLLSRLGVLLYWNNGGRCCCQGMEFVTHYSLEYQRDESENWRRHRSVYGQEIFTGNRDVYTADMREVDPPIIAKKIRFIPYSDLPRTVCMRVEMYGCVWEDEMLSYSMPQGHRRGSDLDLSDWTFDGYIKTNKTSHTYRTPSSTGSGSQHGRAISLRPAKVGRPRDHKDKNENEYLQDGLGQLTDGQTGGTNFRLAKEKKNFRGYEWVGWKNDSLGGSPLTIYFKFDSVRNFSQMALHVNNHFDKDVRIFRRADIFYSVGGRHYQANPTRVDFAPDNTFEKARTVTLKMEHRIGQYLKINFYFQARWIMISELWFTSERATGNVSEETPPATTLAPANQPTATRKTNVFDAFNVDPDNTGGAAGGARGSASDSDLGGAGTFDVGETEGRADDQDNPITEEKEEKEYNNDYISIIIGALGALVFLLLAVVLIFFCRHKRRKNNSNGRGSSSVSSSSSTNGHVLKPVGNSHVTINLTDVRGSVNGKVSNGNMYNSIATDDADSDRDASAGGCCNGGSANGSVNGSGSGKFGWPAEHRDYAVPDITKSALVVALPPRAPASQLPLLAEKPPNYDALYAAADIVTVHGAAGGLGNGMQGVSGNNVYAVPNAELLCSIDYSVMELRREDLRFVEVLGEGQFGEVHLCEALRTDDLMADEIMLNRSLPRNPLLVAVKMLRPTADDRARADFHKEIKIMSQLKDLNIVRVLGVCTREEPLCMVVEYMKHGDLNQFLIDHEPESPMAQASNIKTLSYGCLIFIAGQIASGMKYLESLNMVHRDLATRNCLVGHNFLIKISDFGMSRSLYSSDYYRIEGRAVLPIRWMAWESILLGKFTTKSDVWSFAVTLWEVLTFCREQPFLNLSDEAVIENAGHCYRDDGLQAVLPMPNNCPKEIYDLMCECWNRNDGVRPTFREVHMFLQRKNMGYNPADEKLGQLGVLIC
ncbi:hypothetical protein RRG08_018964 [Elysia crispata]|uniref:Discoidin domain-containing receptor 2 n=1 Tax=Elysia crispata TaxID=231223 RepID=A0AAE1A5J0_9GAST|nr:hypothetical protein RRG08_018964 [Elysia crispata]